MGARTIVACGASAAVHLILAASAMRGAPALPASDPSELDLRPHGTEPADLVEVTLTRPPDEPEPEPPPEPGHGVPGRLMLASRSSDLPSRSLPDVPGSPVPTEPGPGVPAPPGDAPIVVLRVPSPREAARREVLLGGLTPLTDEERVEGRVRGIMEDALSPLPDDTSPMPTLVSDGQGNLVHRDGALTATIHSDGTVDFGTEAAVGVDEFGGGPDDEIRDLHTTIPGVPLSVSRANEADCAAGRCYDKAGPGVTFRPSMDLNDLVLKARGEDPLAARKRRFLRLTEELRDRLADEDRRRSLSRAKLFAGRNLERIWSDAGASFATKRLLLFRLWDECEEPEGEDDDRPEARAGRRARRHVLGFIREKLPFGSAEAYSSDELDLLNASRTSREVFSP
jgi:hypothetical protein